LGIELPSIEMINSPRMLGRDIEGVIIKFYIRHDDINVIGNKVTFQSACKTIVSDIIEKGKEPYSEHRKDEVIDGIVSPLSIVSRMTTDLYNLLYCQKVLVELKEQVRDIYES